MDTPTNPKRRLPKSFKAHFPHNFPHNFPHIKSHTFQSWAIFADAPGILESDPSLGRFIAEIAWVYTNRAEWQ